MPAVSLRDERLLHQALDAAPEHLDLPLTSRQVAALARETVRRLPGERAAPVVPVFREPG